MKKLLALLLILLISHSVKAQIIFKGKVIEKISQEPLEAAVVEVVDSHKTVVTDGQGNFSISVNPSTITDGHLLLHVSFIGFESKEVIAYPGDPILITMEKSSLSLKEVTITPQAGHYNFTNLSKIDLNLRPAKSSQELLRIVPGLFISQHAGGGKAEQLFLRGFDLDHGTDIQISVDGMPVNMVSHAHGQGYADMHFIIPELVKNMDYGLGPYYTSHGNLAVAGFVELKTLTNIQNNTVKVEVGQFNTKRGLAIINLLKKDAKKASKNWYIAAEYISSDGPFESPQKFRRYNVFSKYSNTLGAKSLITIQGSTFSSRWNASGQIPERAVSSGEISRFGSIDDKEGGQTDRTNFNLQIVTKWNEHISLSNQIYYSLYNFNLFSNFTFFLNDSINGDQINQKENRQLAGYNSLLNYTTSIGDWNFKTTISEGFRTDQIKGIELSHTKDRAILLNQIQYGDINETNFFAFIEQSVSNNKWSFILGNRYDYFDFRYKDHLKQETKTKNVRSIISPKLQINYTVNQNSQVYFKMGKGFHSNDTRLAITNNGKEILPAAFGTDLGVLLRPVKNLIVNATVWYLFLQQENIYVGDEGIVEPSGKTKRMGIDLSARYQITKWLFADMNANITKPRAVGASKGSDYIPLAPAFSSIGGLSFKAMEGWNGSIRYRYLQDRAADETNSIKAKGYTVADASINYTRTKYEIGIFAENIFNSNWNEAQFLTESKLMNEAVPVSELHFTPGNPFNIRVKCSIFF